MSSSSESKWSGSLAARVVKTLNQLQLTTHNNHNVKSMGNPALTNRNYDEKLVKKLNGLKLEYYIRIMYS